MKNRSIILSVLGACFALGVVSCSQQPKDNEKTPQYLSFKDWQACMDETKQKSSVAYCLPATKKPGCSPDVYSKLQQEKTIACPPVVCPPKVLPPRYLQYQGWKKCLLQQKKKGFTYFTVCMPATMPKTCDAKVWKKLSSDNGILLSACVKGAIAIPALVTSTNCVAAAPAPAPVKGVTAQ
jgi:hypothetical protein